MTGELQIRRWAELAPDAQAAVFESPAFRAAASQPLYSALSQRFYQAYFGANSRDLSLVALRGASVAGYLPADALEATASYFGMPARAFGEETGALVAALAVAAAGAGCADLKLDERDTGAFRGDARLGPVQATETAVVDLGLDAAAIKAGLRKSYKSLVNWGLRNLELKVLDRDRSDKAAYLSFREFHRAVAGRSTRSDETWEIQFEMIRQGEAYAVLGYQGARLVSANLLQHSAREAYYGVGVYDRALMAQRAPLAHGPLFHAILHAKALGLQKFVLGDATQADDEKLGNIARFKRGFASAIERGGWAQLRLA